MSKLFRFRLLADSGTSIPITELLGQKAVFSIDPRSEEARSFLAIVSAVRELGLDAHDRFLYELELVPRLWAMTQTNRAQIFENLDAFAIVNRMFDGSGVSVADARTEKNCRVRPYCVQYLESDFDFVLRLLEEEGYVFQCDAEHNAPVFTVRNLASSFLRTGPVRFLAAEGSAEERISKWAKTRILCATKVSARDHYFQAAMNPALDGSASLAAPSDQPIPGREDLPAGWSASVEHYPGDWAHLFEGISMVGAANGNTGYTEYGHQRARRALRQIAGATSGSEGTSNCHRLTPGKVFELVGHPAAVNGEHVVLSLHHTGSQALDHSGDAREYAYENRFTCIPANDTMYLPPRTTRKPVIPGCQTAVVLGNDSSKEIWTDKYGRVQVRFWWDRDQKHSCWIRVATSWAGSGWGLQHVPRVGQEVVVTFVDGDPDRPLIVGSVYNPSHMPPFALPANKTCSGIRSNSTPTGEEHGSNEIRFDDAAGNEEIYIHAQKDRTSLIENDSVDVAANNLAIVAGNEIHLKAAKIVIEADSISIRTSDGGREFIHLAKRHGITIDSKGEEVWINCGGAKSPDDGWFKESDEP